MFSAALCNNTDEHFIERQAGDWVMLYHQLDALMQAAWELNDANASPVMLCVRGKGNGISAAQTFTNNYVPGDVHFFLQ